MFKKGFGFVAWLLLVVAVFAYFGANRSSITGQPAAGVGATAVVTRALEATTLPIAPHPKSHSSAPALWAQRCRHRLLSLGSRTEKWLIISEPKNSTRANQLGDLIRQALTIMFLLVEVSWRC